MVFEEFEPIYGEPKLEWINPKGSNPPSRFLLHVHAPNSSNLSIHVTDFGSNTWEAKRNILQLEDMRDDIGIGGSWSEFIDYVTASLKSEDTKLVLEGRSNFDGIVSAKLVAQKSKGMPRISLNLTKLEGSAASEASANLSLGLFKAFKNMHLLLVNEQEHSCLLTKTIAAQEEKIVSIERQLGQHSKRQKLQNMSSSEKSDVSGPLMSSGLLNSPDKKAAENTVSTKVANRVVPAFRRAKVRGAVLLDLEDDKDN